ncbi:MAG: hypothetical protein SFV51_16390 [Bryobacteraceae bacterium]|nr:hypothetical protein [Bryobacteraceae bacterium]
MQAEEPRLLLDRILRSRLFRGDGRLSQALIRLVQENVLEHEDELRAALRDYFENEGRRERLRAALPADQRTLYFYEAAAVVVECSAVERFWQPHLASGNNLLLHGVLESGGVELDEMYTVLCIATWLQEQGGKLEVRPASCEEAPADADIILTGSAATNPLVEEDGYSIRRRPAPSPGRVITVIRHLEAARIATDEEAMSQAGAPFPDGFPADFGLKF